MPEARNGWTTSGGNFRTQVAGKIMLYPFPKILTSHLIKPRPSSVVFQLFMVWLPLAFSVIPSKTWSFHHTRSLPLPRHLARLHSSTFSIFTGSHEGPSYSFTIEFLYILQKSAPKSLIYHMKTSLISPVEMVCSYIMSCSCLKHPKGAVHNDSHL